MRSAFIPNKSSPIANFLLQFRDEKIVFFPNPGNAGDSIIAAATYQLFEKLGIRYETPNFRNIDLSNRVVIYGGGGNLVGPNTHSARLMAENHKKAKRFVVLPHTIKNIDSLLKDCGANVDIITRERISYEYVQSRLIAGRTYLMDDMAFSLNVNEILNEEISDSRATRVAKTLKAKVLKHQNPISLINLMRSLRQPRIHQKLRQRHPGTEIFCYRTDGERTNVRLPKSNIDLSEVFMFGVETKESAVLSARTLLRFLSEFDTVHTNRLHVAISSTLLGLDVRFHSNDYYKCRAVYEYSMQDRFPNVKWVN